MVRVEVLRKRLGKLNEYLGYLERLRHYSVEEFLAEPERYGSAERFLQLSIEALNDVGSHVITDERLGAAESSRDVPRLLHEHGLIDSAAAQSWMNMVGFRNILVHEYLDLDRRIVHDVLQNHLDDLRKIANAFGRYL